MVRQIQTRERACKAQVLVEGEEGAAQVRRRLEVAQQPAQEGAWQHIAGVAAVVGHGVVAAGPVDRRSMGCAAAARRRVVKDDDLVDAEDGQGAGDGAGQGGLQLG